MVVTSETLAIEDCKPDHPAVYLQPFGHSWSSIFRSCIFSHRLFVHCQCYHLVTAGDSGSDVSAYW